MPQDMTVAKNLRSIMYDRGITQAELSKKLGISKGTLSCWMNGTRIPRMHNIDTLCEYLGCSRADLVGETVPEELPYYINKETVRIAQEIFDNPDTRMLLDASRNARPEDIRLAAEMLRRFKETNSDG